MEKITKDRKEMSWHPLSCSHCASSLFHKHGSQAFTYVEIKGTREVKRKRFRCHSCGKTISSTLPDRFPHHNMERRVAEQVAFASLAHPFTYVAKKFGVSESTVRKVFADYFAELEVTHRFEPPTTLGLDPIRLIHDSLLVTNLSKGTVIEILPSNKPSDLSRHLSSLRENPPEVVCIGMWPLLLEACRAVLPNAKIAVPWRHVVSLADTALENIRKSTRRAAKRYDHKKLECDRLILRKARGSLSAWDRRLLDGWRERFPLLTQAYEVREDLADIADSRTVCEVERRCNDWASGLSPRLQDAFAEVLRAISEWREPLSAAFDLDIPNPARWDLPAQVEEVHRMGRGYSFDALRARLLFTSETHKVIQNDGRIRNLGVDAGAILRKMTRYKPGHQKKTLRRSRHL